MELITEEICVEQELSDRSFRVPMKRFEDRLGKVDIASRGGLFFVWVDVECKLLRHGNPFAKRVRVNGICSYFVLIRLRVKCDVASPIAL